MFCVARLEAKLSHMSTKFFFFFRLIRMFGQIVCTSTNFTDPKINNYINLYIVIIILTTIGFEPETTGG